jgi:hypothetical protein
LYQADNALQTIQLVRPCLLLFWTENQDRATVMKILGVVTLLFVSTYSTHLPGKSPMQTWESSGQN